MVHFILSQNTSLPFARGGTNFCIFWIYVIKQFFQDDMYVHALFYTLPKCLSKSQVGLAKFRIPFARRYANSSRRCITFMLKCNNKLSLANISFVTNDIDICLHSRSYIRDICSFFVGI